jgi:hypothetical protein
MNPRTFNLPPGVTPDDIDPPEHDEDEQDREADAADHKRDMEVADNL